MGAAEGRGVSGFLLSHPAGLSPSGNSGMWNMSRAGPAGAPRKGRLFLLLLYLAARAKAFGARGAGNGLIPSLPVPN